MKIVLLENLGVIDAVIQKYSQKTGQAPRFSEDWGIGISR